ncbi:alpha/beta fold hydrolase [Anaerolineales bacterium HSG6]|nr:alpha/beta fold hydrolase [Anaerolineales bacterium HSG6]MDM8530722.1 alpha/beta fold hydrolase [Anaerolineales bacterium HSG25]
MNYPFESHYLELDGPDALKYHYLDEGPPDGQPVVMVHGNPTWSYYYRTLIPYLSDRYRIIVPDHIGCGLSDKPQDYSYTLEQHIQNLTQLLAHLKLTDINLVVHDWGGAIGMGYATRHPETMSHFVIFNTAAFYVDRVPKRIKLCRVPVLGEWLVRGLNGFARAALVFASSQRHRLTPEVSAGYLAPYNSWANRIATHRFVMDIPLEKNHPTRATVHEIESNLHLFQKHPMLIVWGADDFCFTAEHFLPQWQKLFPQAEVHLLPNAGHYVVEDAHEQIGPWMVEFLGR